MSLRHSFWTYIRRALAVLGLWCVSLTVIRAEDANSTATNTPSSTVTNTASGTNGLATDMYFTMPTLVQREEFTLSTARYLASTHEWKESEVEYLKLLVDEVPEATRQTALFEMAGVVQSENDLPRSQSIYSQYLQRWPGDAKTPEIYLHQGQIFRQMGLPNMALTKFYGVMTMALSIKNSQLDYYKGLVLQAQVEIAETHYMMGQFKDAVDYYSRLLAQNDPALDRAQIQFRLIRSLEEIKHHDQAVEQAQDFLNRYPSSPEEPEVRYHLAQAYKGQGRSSEALQEIENFLKEEHDKTTNNPAVWSYWQQRVGNEIGNELYQEGDYVKALQVYMALTQLDPSPAWQLPVRYQVGLTYEKLLQPKMAIEAYRNIVTNTIPSLNTNLAPNLKSITDMASWRLNFLEWNQRAETFSHQAVATTSTNLNSNQP